MFLEKLKQRFGDEPFNWHDLMNFCISQGFTTSGHSLERAMNRLVAEGKVERVPKQVVTTFNIRSQS